MIYNDSYKSRAAYRIVLFLDIKILIKKRNHLVIHGANERMLNVERFHVIKQPVLRQICIIPPFPASFAVFTF